MNRISIFMGILVVTASSSHAEPEFNSDRPGVADGSEDVGRGRVQIETGFQRDSRKAGDDPRRETFFPTLVRIGFAEDWEARLESDVYSWMRQSDGTRAEGWAPFSLGFKYHFLEAQGAIPSVGAIVRLAPPSGSNGLRTRHTVGDVRLAADWELGSRWSLNPNIGLGFDEDDEGRRFSTRLLATTLAYRPVPKLELSIDLAAQSPEAHAGRTAVLSSASLAYMFKRDLQVDLTLGGRSAGSTPPQRFLAAGFSVRF
jgi:outer membrane putative beta-barrel porin/alpha-amylase